MQPVPHSLREQGLCEASLGYQQQACCVGIVVLEPCWCLTGQIALQKPSCGWATMKLWIVVHG